MIPKNIRFAVFWAMAIILYCQLGWGQSPYQPYQNPKVQLFDNSGAIASGFRLCSFAAGTTTPQVTYADSSGTPNANPVVLDGSGRATVYLGASAYKFILYDASGNSSCPNSGAQIWSQDNISDVGQLLSPVITNPGSGVSQTITQQSGTSLTVSGVFDVSGTSNYTSLGTFNAQSDPFQFVTNGIDIGAEQLAVDSQSTEGLSAGVLVPLGSTQPIVNAIGGYVQQASGVTTGAVGVKGQCRITSGISGSRCWGGTFMTANKVGATQPGTLYGVEMDWVPNHASDSGSGFLAVNNTQSLSGYVGGFAFNCGAGTPANAKWAYCFQSQDAQANEFANVGATCTSGTCPSQTIDFRYYISGTPHFSTMGVDASGNFLFPTIANTVFNGGIQQGSGFKHQRFGATTATAASANATATTTYSWTSAFNDANYTPVCTPGGTITGTPVWQGIVSFNASGVTVQVMAATAVASSFGAVYCHAAHD